MGNSTVAEAISTFGRVAKAKLTDPLVFGQPEDQLRNPLEQLFEALAQACGRPAGSTILVGETSLSDLKTRPDFSVTYGLGKVKALVGFIEVKAPGKGTDPRKFKDKHDKEQWAKLKALPNLIYTDGNGFSLWQDGELVSLVEFDGDIEKDGAKLGAPPALLPLIDSFLGWSPIPPKNAHDLAVISARLCRFLRDEVIEQIGQEHPELTSLAEDWRGLLFPEASDAQFADGYAQAVTFGLLMAKSEKIELSEGLDKVASDLAESNTLIGRAFRLLTEQKAALGPSLDTLVRVLDVVNWDVVAKGDPEAWINFYELFLNVYDKQLRKKTGSYYTPPEVVRTMVRLCDEALKSRFNKPAGLADAEVEIADPAVGSGTFLLGLLRHIADWKDAEEGKGAVGPFMITVAKRLFGFELQFGPFAVAQLRIHAEMIELAKRSLPDGAKVDPKSIETPRLFVTDTLGDPDQAFERGTGIYAALSKSQEEANEVKRAQPITVVIGNPPYKNEAMGKGSWIEQGSGNVAAPLDDWQPPISYGRVARSNAKHLRNLYVYFWRWAAWKVFESGHGKNEPSGIVCYITAAGFLNGPGFQKMRADLRRDCDDIWVIDCSPEGMMPEINTRIFQGVKHAVCIVIALRSPTNDTNKPARVHHRQLPKGHREAKFEDLKGIALDGKGWSVGAPDWRAPFLPEFTGGWADFLPLEQVIGYSGPGLKAGRTWVIAPDAQSLTDRWERLVEEPSATERGNLFENKVTDRHIAKSTKAVNGLHGGLASIEASIDKRKYPSSKNEDTEVLKIRAPLRHAFRSFDRQWIIPDARVIDRPRPELWRTHGPKQAYLTAPMDVSPQNGPAATLTAIVPDQHHYHGRGGHVFRLWKDAAARNGNVCGAAILALTKTYGEAPKAEDVFSYVAALLASPAYTKKFKADLVRPGLRVPLTADKRLFEKAAKLGREVVWLHTFGERFDDPANGRPAGQPRLPDSERPFIPKEGAIPSAAEGFPDAIDYDPAKRRLKVGTGYIENVSSDVWAYEVSGKQVLRQWFSYRKKDREKPQIGERRSPSQLNEIQAKQWLPEYTTELLNVINVLGLLVNLEPKQSALLDEIVDGPLIPASKITTA